MTAAQIPTLLPRASSFSGYLLVIGVVLSVCLGCGEGLPASVGGVVTIDGQPVPSGERIRGTVSFIPVGSGAPAYGTIGAGGAYELKTGAQLGLQPGQYKVTVDVSEIAPQQPGAMGPPALKLLTSAQYAESGTTPLAREVNAGANEINLDVPSAEP